MLASVAPIVFKPSVFGDMKIRSIVARMPYSIGPTLLQGNKIKERGIKCFVLVKSTLTDPFANQIDCRWWCGLAINLRRCSAKQLHTTQRWSGTPTPPNTMRRVRNLPTTAFPKNINTIIYAWAFDFRLVERACMINYCRTKKRST